MKPRSWLVLAALAACGGSGSASTFSSVTSGPGGGASVASNASTSTGASTSSSTSSPASSGSSTSSSGAGGTGTSNGGSTSSSTSSSAGVGGSGSGSGGASSASSSSSGGTCGPCPTGYTCGTANGIPVCRSATGIPLFSHVFVVMMENTSLATLQAAMNASPTQAPNLKALAAKYATGSAYHGVAHPSLPNYIALTSGDTQGIGCDCFAKIGGSTCYSNSLACDAQLLTGSTCSCATVSAMNLGDQLEAAGLTWTAFGEDMGTPCNLTDSGNYAQRHVPFLYYEDIQTNAARCAAHALDYSSFAPSLASTFSFIAPNLVDDMHNPDPTTSVNIPNGDKWIGPQVAAIMASPSFTQGGLLVVLWDEDDASGGTFGTTDNPIGIFVMSPYAKAGGYVSSVTGNHYSLLATIEDGLGLGRLGNAAKASPLADYFPPN